MQIPLVDLERQYRAHKDALDRAVRSCLDATRFVGGPPLEEFEEKFARYCGSGYAAACSSGTDALYLAIVELLGRGDGTREIITVSHTFLATVEAITLAGYRPVLVDIEPNTYLMDLEAVENAISNRTVAIVPVHLYGQMVDMVALQDIAERHSLAVVEDAAQAHGAERDGHRPGQASDAACFSFYPGKNLGAWGDGGAVYTRNRELAVRIRMRSDHGRDPQEKYVHAFPGQNSRLDSIQAAVLNVKLDHLDEWNDSRRRAAKWYTNCLADHPEIVTPSAVETAKHVFHLYVVSINDRDHVLEELQARGIGAGVHYPLPVHRQPAYAELEPAASELAVTEAAARSVLSLPLFPELSRDEVDYIARVLMQLVDAQPAT